MKARAGFIPVFFGILVLLAGCQNMLTSSGGAPVPEGKGRVEIRVEDEARTALPSGSFDKYMLRFAYTETEGYTHDDVEWSSGTSVDLEPGDWVVYVDAYVGETVSGTGSAAVTVNAGLSTPVTIHVGINTGAGQGTLKYKVSYPTAGTYGTETLTVRDVSGTVVGLPETLLNDGVIKSLQLSPGVYFVGVVIIDDNLRIGVARTSVAHIYGGKETDLEFTIADEEFTALVPITVTANLTAPGGITVSRKIAAYSNAACTESLLTPETVSSIGSAEITLWMPSENADVYVRQEVEIGGVTLNGVAQQVTIANPVEPATVSLADTLYKISLDPGIPIETVTSAVPAAFPGFSVTVTVTPGESWELKAGTLKYNDGTNDYPITETDPNYAFVMPNADVTVKAEFYHFIWYVSENGSSGTGNGSDAYPYITMDAALDGIRAAYDDSSLPWPDKGASYAQPAIIRIIGTVTEAIGDTDSMVVIKDAGSNLYDNYPPIILEGTGTLNAGGASASRRVFYIENADVTLYEDLTLTGGNVSGDGGGVYVNSGTFTMSGNAVVSDNNATSHGGGVYVAGGNFAMNSDAAISGNTAAGDGGGVYFASSEKFNMVGDTVVSGNEATDGGGVYFNNGTFEMSSSSSEADIRNNTATGNGGGVYVAGGTFDWGRSYVHNDISGNKATGSNSNGGGVYVAGGYFYLNGGAVIGGSTTADANTAVNGGGVYVNSGTFTMTQTSAISGNQAASGGGVYVGSSGTFTMFKGSISDNTATGTDTGSGGGGVYVYSGGTFKKENSDPPYNSGIIYGDTDTTHTSGNDENTAASGLGHAAYVAGGPEKRNSTAGTGVPLDSAISGPPGGWDGTSAYIADEISAASDSGTIILPAGTYDMTTLVEVNKNITITTASNAEVILKRNSGFVDDNMFKVTSGSLTFQVDTDGTLTLDGNSGEEVTASGSLVSVTSGDLTMNTGVTLQNNDTTGDGGGVNFAGAGTFTMSGGTISNNTATARGGGVYFAGTSFTMSGGTISGNQVTATNKGGGVYVAAGDFSMSGGTIGGDTDADANKAYNGGGVFVTGSGVSFTMPAGSTATIKGNTATNGGGVDVDTSGSFDMDGGTISDNKASYGGGVFVGNGTFTMDGGTISNNTTARGGGVYLNSGSASFTMSGGTISGNTATTSGGGVNVAAGTFTMSGGTISGNTATTSGGGVYVGSGSFTKTGGTIYGGNASSGDKNTAGDGNGHAAWVITVSLKRNSTAGPGIDLDRAKTTILGGWEVLSSGGIQDAIDALLLASRDTLVLPAGTYDMTATVGVSAAITITTEPGAAVILERQTSLTGNMILVDSGGSLTLQAGTDGTLTLDGNSGEEVTASGSLVSVTSGDLTMNTGVTLQNNDTTGDGGGVNFAGAGTFTMNGGTISGNKTTGSGGGVYFAGTTFSMSGGAVSKNTVGGKGGGVYLTGSSTTFNLSGTAAIKGNTGSDGGGGVYVAPVASFYMAGGTISDNRTGAGGGVCVEAGNFVMSGTTAAVSGNEATVYGGGVYVMSGSFAMSDGTIGGSTDDDANSAEIGGGVYVASGTFTMSGGAVSGNEATVYGGGVYVYSGTFTKSSSGGTIYGNMQEDGTTSENTALQNTATDGGHAVYVHDASSPKIRNRTAGTGTTLDSSTGTAGVDPWYE